MSVFLSVRISDVDIVVDARHFECLLNITRTKV